MGNLNKLDFDITGGTFPQEGNVKFIDISSKKKEPVTKETEEDKYISFSADLIKCFKDKVKKRQNNIYVIYSLFPLLSLLSLFDPLLFAIYSLSLGRPTFMWHPQISSLTPANVFFSPAPSSE